MLKKDWIERLLEQLASVVRRALGRAEAGDVEGALALFDMLYRSLGVGREALDKLDDATLRAMLGDRAPTLALVVMAEADVLDRGGRAAEAKARRALALRLVP